MTITVYYQYGEVQWGERKASQYLDIIKNCFENLMMQPLLGVCRSSLIQGIRSIPCQKHIVFYRYRKRSIEIVRVLQMRQDPQRHLR